MNLSLSNFWPGRCHGCPIARRHPHNSSANAQVKTLLPCPPARSHESPGRIPSELRGKNKHSSPEQTFGHGSILMSVASAAAVRSASGRRCGVGSGLNGGNKFLMMQRRDIVTKGIALSVCSSLLSSSNGDAQGLERLPFKADGYNFWTWRGRRIHYVEQGEGQPIVLVHGFGASAFHWRYNIPELAKKYKVYAVDLLGFGWSEKALVEYDATIWMEQVSDFLREVVKSPSVLVGNSLGGFTTLFTATELPELVRGLVLLNSAGQFGDPNAPPPIEAEEEVGVLSRLLVRPIKEAFQRVVLGFLFWQAKQPARVEKVLKSVYKDPSNVDDYLISSITAPTADPNAGEVYYRLMSRFMANQSRYTLDRLLGKLSCPLLLLWGDLDPWVGPSKAARIKEFYKNSTVVNLQAGHCPHDEAPEQFNAALLQWLDTLEETGTGGKSAEPSLQAV
ncbi:pheophytinase, chloroplastic isoform X2 [Brachypodium distachyon]|nr:pheophytinase, chloroplastic isoform X2 [Brachypodium distachyon]|eukprot:XP_003572859.2 pheophytinase, chloroplastic isoform X2 [Brachypodium distachyon]